MNIEFDVYKQKLNDCRPALEGLADSLNIEGLRNELERLHAMQEAPGFWDDPEKSQKIVVKTKQTENKVEHYEKMLSAWDDLMTICEMAAEEDDDSMLEELKEGFEKLAEEMETCRLETLLTGHYDKNNALMSFHAGAGGTEAQDWAQMLYRMYTRWAERHGFTYKIMDYQEGDEAGLKSADILIEGENAYGFLKGENGVHRLVRVSPFDANARRQTSFSAVEVIPDIEDDSQDVEIRPEDYEMQVYRSSGAGGQHINKTSSDSQGNGDCGILPDGAQPVPEQGDLSAYAAQQAGGDQGAGASGQDFRYQGRSAEDRVGQPDSQLRVHALYLGEGHPDGLRDLQCECGDGWRPGPLY